MASDDPLSPDYPGYQDPDASAYDLLGMSPLKSMGIDPDQARANPQAALQSVRTGQPMAAPAPAATPAAAPAPAVPTRSIATPGSVTPSGNPNAGATPSWSRYAQQAMQGQQAALDRAQQADQALQSEGTLDAKTADLEKQRQTAATPINPQAAQYRPSLPQRLARGVGAGLEGLAKGGLVGATAAAIDPKLVGGTAYGAPNKAYDIAAQQQQGTVSNLDQQLQQSQAAYKANSDRQKALASENRQLATGYGDIEKNAVTAMDTENKPPKAPPDGERPLGASVGQLNSILADRYHVLNPGKSVPSQYVLPADATQKDYDRIDKGLSGVEGAQGTLNQRKQTDAFRQTALDLAGSRRNSNAPKATPAAIRDRIESQKDTAINKAKSDYDSGVSSLDDYLNVWQGAQNDYEDRISAQTGESVPHLDIRNNVDSRGNWIGSKQAAQTGAARPQSDSGNQQRFVTRRGSQVSVGAPVNVDGRRGTVTGFNAKTGKAQVRWEDGR